MAEPAFSAALVTRCLENYRDLFRVFARLSPRGQLVERDGLVLSGPGAAAPRYNIALLTRPPADVPDVILQVRAFFAPLGLQAVIGAAGEAATAIAPLARAAGFSCDTSPGMVWAPLAGEGMVPPGFEVRRVLDIAMLRIFDATMAAGFAAINAWVETELLESGALLEVPDLTFYLGYLDGEPVATATRLTSRRITGLFDISVLPAYRGRGYGAAITRVAALEGAAEGCLASYLQSSELGLPVYRRLGYRTLVQHDTWFSHERQPATAPISARGRQWEGT